jgi:hypothetical protein
MYHEDMKKILLFLLFTLSRSDLLIGFDATPPCAKQLERDFFRATDIIKTMSTAQTYVMMNQWTLIAQEMEERSHDIHKLIKSRASELSPDPTEYPYNPEEAGKIYREIFFNYFSQIMEEHHVADPAQIQQMFNYLLFAHKSEWDHCFPKNPKKTRK